MAGVDQGAALQPSSFAYINQPRVYSVGLNYEEGFGVATNANPGYDVVLTLYSGLYGPRTNVDRPAIAKPAPAEAGVGSDDSDKAAGTIDWFEKVHALPRAKIEFGNIITAVTEEYEVYSSFRRATVTLSSVTNGTTPGTTLTDLTIPQDVEPQTSILDPASTGNPGPTEVLGTLIKLEVTAEQDGLPSFDGDITFNFSGANSPLISLSGQRIILIPLEYESPMEEVLGFLTDIIGAIDGGEQRIALRANPRQEFLLKYSLDGNDRQRMQALLMDWMDNSFGLPLWHEQVRLTAATIAGATSYPVSDADEVDFRVGGLAVVFTDANTFDVINITAKTSTTITAGDPAVNAYPAGTLFMPLRVVSIMRAVAGTRHANDLEDFQIAFQSNDDDTGALTGDTTPGVWSTYNSKVLFDDCNMITGTMPQRFERKITRVDNATGRVTIKSNWEKYKRVAEKGIVAHNRAEIMKLRKLLIALQGRVKSFYIPTFINDLTVAADLQVSTNVMDINRIEYNRLIVNRAPKATFRITFTDDTQLVRTITASADHPSDPTLERLTIDSNWPADRTVAEISRIEFYEQVRFDTDRFRLKYPRIGEAHLVAPVKAVFD